MKSRYFTYTVVQEPDPAGLEEDGYIPLEAVVFTKFLKKDGTLRSHAGPYMAFYPGHEPPSSVVPELLALCDRIHEQKLKEKRA